MRTFAERQTELHRRIAARQAQREKKRTASLSIAGGALSLILVVLMIGRGRSGAGPRPGLYTGTALIYGDVGGYVLAAVLAFMIGVIITVILMRNRIRDAERKDDGGKELSTEKEEER